jgi:two-component system response regulator HydG
MSHRILIVDDSSSVRFALADYLRGLGHSVDCAVEREEAEALLVSRRYSVVIADLRLTSVHGAEGLEVINLAREVCPGARSVLLTAYASKEIEREASRRGASAVIQKPKPLAEVVQVVTALLKEAS